MTTSLHRRLLLDRLSSPDRLGMVVLGIHRMHPHYMCGLLAQPDSNAPHAAVSCAGCGRRDFQSACSDTGRSHAGSIISETIINFSFIYLSFVLVKVLT